MNNNFRKAFLVCLALVATMIMFNVGSFADTLGTTAKMPLKNGQEVTWEEVKTVSLELHDVPVYISCGNYHYLCNVSILSNSKLEEIRNRYKNDAGILPKCTIKKGTVTKEEFLTACEEDLKISSRDTFITTIEYDYNDEVELVEFTLKN